VNIAKELKNVQPAKELAVMRKKKHVRIVKEVALANIVGKV
jgi:hypothetical protein